MTKMKYAILALSALTLAACGGGGSSAASGLTECTISFESNGGSSVSAIKVEYGKTASKPADPTRSGYTFDGWFADSYLKVSFDWTQSITADWTLYAGWTGGAPSTSSEDSSEPATSSESSPEATSEGTSTPSSSKIYTCTGLPAWITDDGCVIFAWAWGGDAGNGAWYTLTYGEGEKPTEASFDAGSQDLTGFLLARCAAGTTTPDWEIKTNEPGRVYNQTENIDCTDGVYSYACASWKEYK